MEPENREILLQGAEAFGIDLAEGAILAFDIYLRELLKWNQKINLSAIQTEKGVVIKHFLDSLSVCSHIPGHTSLLDVGSQRPAKLQWRWSHRSRIRTSDGRRAVRGAERPRRTVV